jgi:hypothetical protein
MNTLTPKSTLTLQQALVKLFWHSPTQVKSLNFIDRACYHLESDGSKMLYNYWGTLSYARNRIFYPLLRLGIVEHCNNGYCLSPSTGVFNSRVIILCNVPVNVKFRLTEFCLKDTHLGVEVYRKTPFVTSILDKYKVEYKNVSISDLLNKIRSFEDIISSWNDDTVIDESRYYFLNGTNQYVLNNSKADYGIFKKSNQSYAEKVIKISQNLWKSLPHAALNPDRFNIALVWNNARKNLYVGCKYFKGQGILIVETKYFPFLIERILIFSTLLNQNLEVNILERKYYLEEEPFQILNKIFSDKIQVI